MKDDKLILCIGLAGHPLVEAAIKRENETLREKEKDKVLAAAGFTRAEFEQANMEAAAETSEFQITSLRALSYAPKKSRKRHNRKHGQR